MIVHIVMFKFKEENKNNNIKQLADKLHLLKSEIPELLEMEVGVDFKQSDRSYDLSLYSKFSSKENLASYSVHKKHLEVLDFIQEVVTDIKSVDYQL